MTYLTSSRIGTAVTFADGTECSDGTTSCTVSADTDGDVAVTRLAAGVKPKDGPGFSSRGGTGTTSIGSNGGGTKASSSSKASVFAAEGAG